MMQKVSKYCHAVLARLFTTSDSFNPSIFDLANLKGKNIVFGSGFMVYHIERRGYYGIVGDDGKHYYPSNLSQFPKFFKDRKRVRYVLQTYPGVASFYKWGTTARIIALEAMQDQSRISHQQ